LRTKTRPPRSRLPSLCRKPWSPRVRSEPPRFRQPRQRLSRGRPRSARGDRLRRAKLWVNRSAIPRPVRFTTSQPRPAWPTHGPPYRVATRSRRRWSKKSRRSAARAFVRSPFRAFGRSRRSTARCNRRRRSRPPSSRPPLSRAATNRPRYDPKSCTVKTAIFRRRPRVSRRSSRHSARGRWKPVSS
jgi:hypothetical protein